MLLGKNVTKTVSPVQETIKDDDFLSKFQAKNRHKLSENGQVEMVDEATRNEDYVKLVRDRLNSDRRLCVYQITETVNMSNSIVHRAVTALYLEGSKDLKGAWKGTWKFYHDNAPNHTTFVVNDFLVSTGTCYF